MELPRRYLVGIIQSEANEFDPLGMNVTTMR
jgi:hypothetical protein